MKVKNSLILFPLSGSAYAIKDYADTIARFSGSSSNAYVMAFDDDNEILWCVQSNDEESLAECKLTPDVARVEIYDHSAPCSSFGENDCFWKYEQVYLRSGKRGQQSLGFYLESVRENGMVIDDFENRTNLSVDFSPALF